MDIAYAWSFGDWSKRQVPIAGLESGGGGSVWYAGMGSGNWDIQDLFYLKMVLYWNFYLLIVSFDSPFFRWA